MDDFNIYKKAENRVKHVKMLVLKHGAATNCVTLAAFGAVTGLLTLLLGASYYGFPLFLAYFTVPLVLLLNLLPPVLLILLVYFITGRAWLSFSVPALFILIMAVIGFFKLQVRGDPFVASDLSLISETGTIMQSYRLILNWKLFFAGAVYLMCAAVSVFLLRYREKRQVFRIRCTCGTILTCVLLYGLVYSNTDVYNNVRGGFETKEWSYTENYISRGFAFPFIHSIRYAFHVSPDGYSINEAKKLLGMYEDTDITNKVNIISIMLESYTDLSKFEMLNFRIDVYEALHKLQEESVSGELITNVFGGGTIDTERLFLTGYTKLTGYDAPTNSYVRYLNSQGYYTEGIHVGDGWFYDRIAVNDYLGFNNYYYLEDYENGIRDDSFFFPAVRELYANRDKQIPYFSYNLSFQNHGAYESEWTERPYYIEKGSISDESFNILNNYLSGIYDTTQRIGSFIDSFRDDPEPVVIVIFGDHMPWLGNYESVYNELGICVDLGTAEGFYNYYSSPYVIWANDAAKEKLGNSFSGSGGSFSPCFLMGEVFSLCSWDGEGYMRALREVRQYIDVINTPTGLYRINGELTLDLPADVKNAWKDFEKIEYYRLYHFYS